MKPIRDFLCIMRICNFPSKINLRICNFLPIIYVLIDFSKASPSIKEGFNSFLNDLDSLFLMISLEYGVTLYKRESLLIFDEVQSFPRAREAIKHLVKDGRYDYIETGSLISIKENTKDILIPSEEKSIQMYPMDFEEFSWALGEDRIIDYIKQCFNENKGGK